MSDAPNKWTVEVLKRYLENPVTEFSQDGLGYQTARPMGFGSYPTRLSLAWAVFRGKADALFWPRQTLRVNPIQDKLEAHADPDYPILLRPGYKLKVGETDGSWHYLTTKEIENLLMGLRESLPVGGPHLHRMSRSAFDVIREGFVTLGAGTSFRMGEAGRAAWTCPVCNQHLPSAVTTMFHSRQDTNGKQVSTFVSCSITNHLMLDHGRHPTATYLRRLEELKSDSIVQESLAKAEAAIINARLQQAYTLFKAMASKFPRSPRLMDIVSQNKHAAIYPPVIQAPPSLANVAAASPKGHESLQCHSHSKGFGCMAQ